jgi:hypothetical protein
VRSLGPPVSLRNDKQDQIAAEVCGRKVQAAAVGGDSSGFFALERRAQNDKQEQAKENAGVLRLCLAQVRQTPLRMTTQLLLRMTASVEL